MNILSTNQLVPMTRFGMQISTLPINPVVALALTILSNLVAYCIYQINQRNAQIIILNAAVNAATAQNTALANQNTALTNQNAILANQNATLTTNNAALQGEKATLEAEKKDLKANLDNVTAIKATLESTNSDLEQRVSAAAKELVNALAEAEKARNQVKLMEQEVANLKLKLESNHAAPIEMRELTEVSDYLPTDDSLPIEEKENLEQSINQQIGKGKVKQVWIKKNKNTGIVYYTTLTKSAEQELKEEVKTAQTILDQLRKKSAAESEFFLAIDLKESERPIRNEQGTALYTVQCTRADKDLEKFLKESISFNARLQMCLQVLKGLSFLQQAGYVQGDLKPENILVFNADDEPKLKVRISDFGKAITANSESALAMRGNPRFSPPEFETSQKGEVYSAALVLIRVLEEAILTKTGTISLINTEKVKTKAAQQRRGVEKYLVEHPHTYQFDQWVTASGVWATLASYAPSYVAPTKKTSEEAIYAYIDCLAEQLVSNDFMRNSDGLRDLLKSMTCNDKAKRVSMQEARDRWEILVNA